MPDAGTRLKVPVAEVIVEAYRGVLGRLNLLLEIGWMPLLVLLAATILPGYLRLYRGVAFLPAWSPNPFGVSFEDLIEALVGLLCLSAFAVRWYQVLLFTTGQRMPEGVFLGAWLRFLLYTLLLYVIAAILLTAMLLADTGGAPDYLTSLAGVALTAASVAPVRCSLLFPAAACGQPLSIAAAWRALGGNTWRLFAAVMLVSIPTVFVFAMIIGGFFAGFHLDASGERAPPLGFFILRGVLGSCADFLVVALTAAVVAGFYRRLQPGTS
jgi:hypothetical protein